MLFQIPQFIETEDKILGPLTIKQFLSITAAGVGTFLLFYVLQFWLWVVIALIVAGIALAGTVIKYNGRSLLILFVNIFMYAWSSRVYVWKLENKEDIFPEGAIPDTQREFSHEKKATPRPTHGPFTGKLYNLKFRLITSRHSDEEQKMYHSRVQQDAPQKQKELDRHVDYR